MKSLEAVQQGTNPSAAHTQALDGQVCFHSSASLTGPTEGGQQLHVQNGSLGHFTNRHSGMYVSGNSRPLGTSFQMTVCISVALSYQSRYI